MRQRVGLARALVVHPDLLLMDEPFSALDVLTAETLRTDLIDLWSEGKLPIKSVLMVTHNIEEAVLMCDRILVFSVESRPGRERDPGAVPASAQPAGPGVPPVGGRHLCADDARARCRRAPAAPPRPTRASRCRCNRVGTNLMAGLMEALAGAAVQRPRRPAGAGRGAAI